MRNQSRSTLVQCQRRAAPEIAERPSLGRQLVSFVRRGDLRQERVVDDHRRSPAHVGGHEEHQPQLPVVHADHGQHRAGHRTGESQRRQHGSLVRAAVSERADHRQHHDLDHGRSRQQVSPQGARRKNQPEKRDVAMLKSISRRAGTRAIARDVSLGGPSRHRRQIQREKDGDHGGREDGVGPVVPAPATMLATFRRVGDQVVVDHAHPFRPPPGKHLIGLAGLYCFGYAQDR